MIWRRRPRRTHLLGRLPPTFWILNNFFFPQKIVFLLPCIWSFQFYLNKISEDLDCFKSYFQKLANSKKNEKKKKIERKKNRLFIVFRCNTTSESFINMSSAVPPPAQGMEGNSAPTTKVVIHFAIHFLS